MNPYEIAARNFSLAYRAQVDAAGKQSRATAMTPADPGYQAETRSYDRSAAPQPLVPTEISDSLGSSGDVVSAMKSEMLEQARKRMRPAHIPAE